MSSSTPELRDDEVQRNGRKVRCGKCQHLNLWGQNACQKCGAHLYILCSDCSERNERARTRCVNCGRKLHRTQLDRLRRKITGVSGRLTTVQILIFFIGVGLAFAFILLFSRLHVPGLF
jgi:hypothetical protein